MSHGHGHAHGHHGAGAHDVTTDPRKLAVALALIVAFMLVEILAGIIADSLALLSDAAHMLIDAGALLLSLVALRLVRDPRGGTSPSACAAWRSSRRRPTAPRCSCWRA